MGLSQQLPLLLAWLTMLAASPELSRAQTPPQPLACSTQVATTPRPAPTTGIAEQIKADRDAAELRLHNDWPNLARYRDSNTLLGLPKQGEQRVVFIGNSITEGWAPHFDSLFPGKPYVGRGIGGQTTPQMLVRFRQDVIALAPSVVVILGGTNDIAGNTGPATLEMIEANLASMAELATANGIKVVLSSVMPVYKYPWAPNLEPASLIVTLNAWLRDYAAKKGIVYLDFQLAMADERHGLKCDLTYDGVHANAKGYRLMSLLAAEAIAQALSSAH